MSIPRVPGRPGRARLRPGRYLVPALVVMLGLVLIAVSLTLEAQRAQHRLDAITVTYSASSGVRSHSPKSGTAVPTADDLRLGGMLRRSTLWYVLNNHLDDVTWHWELDVATHGAQLGVTPRLQVLNRHPVYRWAEPGTVVPFAGGLLLVLGGLFAAAARRRPRPRPRPLP